MATVTEILNRALALIGHSRVTSIDETSEAGTHLRDLYPECRASLIAAHPWNFATRRSVLAPDSSSAGWGWTYKFRKPQPAAPFGAWLRTVGIWEDQAQTKPANDIEDESGYWILANVDRLYMRSIHDIEDPNRMSAHFREALSAKLAAELSLVITNSQALQDRAASRASEALALARYRDIADALNGVAARALAMVSPERLLAGGDISSDTVRQMAVEQRTALLRSHPWNFAIHRQMVEHDVDVDDEPVSPSFGWAYRFPHPAADEDLPETYGKWLRTVAVTSDEDGECPLDRYHDEDKYIYADETPIYLRYVHDSEREDLWPAPFVEALRLRIAAQLTTQLGDRDQLMTAAAKAERHARSLDAMDEPARQPEMGSWERAMLGGLGSA